MFFMILSKTVEYYQHIENIISLICGAVALVICAFIGAYILEKRLSEKEEKDKLHEEIRLIRAKNEVQREKENFRQIDISLRNIIEIQKEQIIQKDNEIAYLKEKLADYESQLDDVKLGKFKNHRGKKYA